MLFSNDYPTWRSVQLLYSLNSTSFQRTLPWKVFWYKIFRCAGLKPLPGHFDLNVYDSFQNSIVTKTLITRSRYLLYSLKSVSFQKTDNSLFQEVFWTTFCSVLVSKPFLGFDSDIVLGGGVKDLSRLHFTRPHSNESVTANHLAPPHSPFPIWFWNHIQKIWSIARSTTKESVNERNESNSFAKYKAYLTMRSTNTWEGIELQSCACPE